MASFTKKAIRDSFVKLLNEKSLSQITIRDIVDDCGVNRNTFYYYYQDLQQLVEIIVDDDEERIIRRHPTIDSLDECINTALEFALANRKAVLHICHSVHRDIYEQYQWLVCTYVVRTYVDGVLGNRKITSEDYQEFQNSYENKIMLSETIEKLPPELKEVIELSFYKDLNQREISEIMNMSQMQVSRRLKKALNKMYELIKNNE